MKDIKTRAIRVVKRIDIKAAGALRTVVDPVSAKREIKESIIDVVGNWIAERRANRRAENVFSSGKILSWKTAGDGNLEGERF